MNKIFKANCTNHIIHNGTKYASDKLDPDIEIVVIMV